MKRSYEQALARLMGVDLYVWSAQPEFGDGYGDGYSGCGYGAGCGDGIGCGDGYGAGFGYNSGYGYGCGNRDGSGSSREL